MDVEDRNFHQTRPEEAKKLNLPAPDFINHLPDNNFEKEKPPFRPVEDRPGKWLSPNQQTLKNWLNYTTQTNPKWNEYIDYMPGKIKNTRGKDQDYENRVAKSILNTNDVSHLIRILGNFNQYALSEIPGQRSPVVEKAILSKDWSEACKGRYNRAGGGYGKRNRWPGWESIINYAKHNIKGPWPEFEKKVENNVPLSLSYYLWTELNPDNISDGITKDLVLFAKFIKDREPSVSGKEFEASIRDFVTRAREQLKHGHFSPVLYKVIIPYMKLTKKVLDRVVTPEMKKLLLRNDSFAEAVERLYKEWGVWRMGNTYVEPVEPGNPDIHPL